MAEPINSDDTRATVQPLRSTGPLKWLEKRGRTRAFTGGSKPEENVMKRAPDLQFGSAAKGAARANRGRGYQIHRKNRVETLSSDVS